MDTELKRSASEATWQQLATRLDIELAALKAVAEVESSGSGFLPAPDHRPKILFEGHVFHRLTAGRHSLTHPAISHPGWDRSRYARSLAGEWKRLDTAATLDPAAAMQSASWGAFQIMGYHWKTLQYTTLQGFVNDQYTADGQLGTFVRFILADPRLVKALRAGDWATFARIYNGPGYATNRYDTKLAAAYKQFGGA